MSPRLSSLISLILISYLPGYVEPFQPRQIPTLASTSTPSLLSTPGVSNKLQDHSPTVSKSTTSDPTFSSAISYPNPFPTDTFGPSPGTETSIRTGEATRGSKPPSTGLASGRSTRMNSVVIRVGAVLFVIGM
ncbi:hypothetical protein BDV96DRAFT_356525 [Lophiotrema nucula]|uniref:Uncharacterized protein n=1 Tax=Lophiotrema nucula TaxID=690887 RepID=A0A6A5YEL1_9PLEO|nr:hypothetical protein BDV96DRAFT_356525 [Lophiotrema nucula]